MSTRTETVPTIVSQLKVDTDVVLDHIGSGVFISTVKDGVSLLDIDECNWALEMFSFFRKSHSEKEAIQKVIELRAHLIEEESYFNGIDTLRQLRISQSPADVTRQNWMAALLVATILTVSLIIQFIK